MCHVGVAKSTLVSLVSNLGKLNHSAVSDSSLSLPVCAFVVVV
jgi:hypothetical protein